MPRAVAAAVALLAASALADASAEPRRRGNDTGADVVSHEIEVRLAEIEVVVADRRGDPVAGLTRQDFEIFQDGRPVELTHFRAAGGTVAESTAAESTAAEILHLVIYVDRGYLEPGDLRDVRQALKGFLRHTLAPGDRVMLVTAARSLELEQSFTSVPELVVSKLDDVRERPGGGRLTREYQNILVDMARAENEGHDLMVRDASRGARTYVSRIQAYTAEAEGEIRRTTAQLLQLIQSIAGLPGRRVVLYVGGRVPASHGRRLFDAWEDAFGRGSSPQITGDGGTGGRGAGGPGNAGGGGTRLDTGLDSLAAVSASSDAGAQRAIQEVAVAASAHGIVFHTLDAGSQRAPTFLGPGDATLPARGASANPGAGVAGSLADSMASLSSLARGTGGRSHAGGRDFTAALARVGSDLRTYYSLGFEPLEPKGESSRIEVGLRDGTNDRGKLEVRHRPVLELKDLDTLAVERTVSALLLERLENPLAVVVEAGEPAVTEGGEWRVPLSITVPLAKLALVADGRVHTGQLSIYTAAGGLDGVGAVTKAVVPVRIPNRDLLTSLGRRVEYQLELTLPAGRGSPGGGRMAHRIAVTARDDFRPRSSTAVTAFGLEETRDAVAHSEPGSR